MKKSLLLTLLLSCTVAMAASSSTYSKNTVTQKVSTPSTVTVVCPDASKGDVKENTATSASEPTLSEDSDLRIGVMGQGVAPMNTASPAQAYALAKRAAVADAYRLIAEKVKGVKVDGEDLIKNMMVKRSTVRTSVKAMVRNANIVETTYKDGLCEVEMEITLTHADFAQ